MSVSLIIAAYNAEDWIGRATRSCLDQSQTCEVVVVDDASTDATPRILTDFHQINTHLLREHQGLPAAANIGIRLATGQYVARVDADDYIHTDFTRILSLYLDTHPTIGAVACDYTQIHEDTGRSDYHDWQDEPIACAVMYRKDLLVQLGLYDETLQMGGETLDMRLRFQARHQIGHIPIPLYRYRYHGANMTIRFADQHAQDLERARSQNKVA